jgi:hypothetical protein
VVEEVRRTRKEPNAEVVLLVDSVEQLRGAGQDARDVAESARELFVTQAENLRFPKLHVVYTYPPSLLALAQNIGHIYGVPRVMWPNPPARKRDGSRDLRGIDLLQEVVDKRFPARTQFLSDAHLHKLIDASGGSIRHCFLMLRECIVGIILRKGGQVDGTLVEQVIGQLRNEMLPLADEDAAWLRRIHERRDVALDTVEHNPTLVRLFDNNLIMNYENGEPWYDVHPLLLPEIERLRKYEKPG